MDSDDYCDNNFDAVYLYGYELVGSRYTLIFSEELLTVLQRSLRQPLIQRSIATNSAGDSPALNHPSQQGRQEELRPEEVQQEAAYVVSEPGSRSARPPSFCKAATAVRKFLIGKINSGRTATHGPRNVMGACGLEVKPILIDCHSDNDHCLLHWPPSRKNARPRRAAAAAAVSSVAPNAAADFEGAAKGDAPFAQAPKSLLFHSWRSGDFGMFHVPAKQSIAGS